MEKRKNVAWKALRFECRCGCCFHMALSTEVPGVFALAAEPHDAVAALAEKLAPRVSPPSEEQGGLPPRTGVRDEN